MIYTFQLYELNSGLGPIMIYAINSSTMMDGISMFLSAT